MTATQTAIAEIATEDPPYYHFEREERALALPATTTVVTVGGYRLNIRHADGILLSITPKASSAGRGHIILDPWGTTCGDYDLPIRGRVYHTDPCGSQRLRAALVLALDAWMQSEGDVDRLYSALGASGSCAICGAILTDPLSMSRGIGPECYRHIGVGRDAARHVQRIRMTP